MKELLAPNSNPGRTLLQDAGDGMGREAIVKWLLAKRGLSTQILEVHSQTALIAGRRERTRDGNGIAVAKKRRRPVFL